MKFLFCLLVFAWLPFVSTRLVAQAIVLEDASGAPVAFPVVGSTFTVKVDGAAVQAVKLRVQYRPNSKTSVDEEVEASAAGVSWTPLHAGLASISVVGPGDQVLATRTVSVRFAALSSVGLVVMIFAALLLFGGAAISIRALLADG